MIFFNPSFDSTFRTDVPTRLPMEFHKRLSGYQPTPLHSLEPLARQLGVARILVKDESNRLGLPAFKILGASWAMYRALRERFPKIMKEWSSIDELAHRLKSCRSLVLYSATDGNHGRAVAHAARMFGLRSCIYVPKNTVEARISAIASEGASVTLVEGTYDDAVAKAAYDAREQRGVLVQDNSWKGYETIPRYVVEGYSTMLWEIYDALAQMNEPDPTHVVVQIGNGSFADAVVRHFRTKERQAIIIGVEPETAACALESVKAGTMMKVPGPHRSIMVGMNCDSPSYVSWPALLKGINSYVSLSDDWAMDAMRFLAAQKIVSGETGAAGLGALLLLASPFNNTARRQLLLNEQSRVLLLSTEGATDPILYEKIVSRKLN